MALSAFDRHYVDRDLQRTGLSIVIITAGTSHFNVDKNLFRLTTERMIDEGFGVDLVSLAKMPLHAVPLFRYDGTISTTIDAGARKRGKRRDPSRGNGDGRSRTRDGRDQPEKAVDHLYTEDEPTRRREHLYSIPHWVDSSFYAKHQDKPFRCDRFLARCRMPSIQSVGIGTYENASISIPSINNELRLLEGLGPEWEQLSELEKRKKTWERFDEIACGSLGRWEKIHLEEKNRAYEKSALGWHDQRSLAVRNSRNSDSSLLGANSDSSEAEADRAKPRRMSVAQERLEEIPSSAEEDERQGRSGFSKIGSNSSALQSGVGGVGGSAKAQPIQVLGSDGAADSRAPRTSPSRSAQHTYQHLPDRQGVRSSSRPAPSAAQRARADSGATNSTMSRQTSRYNLRSPSSVLASLSPGPSASSAVGTRRGEDAGTRSRTVSSTASSVTAVEKSKPSTTSAAAMLSSLMAANAGKPAGSNANPAGSGSGAGGWFWSRKAKVAPPATTITKSQGVSSKTSSGNQPPHSAETGGPESTGPNEPTSQGHVTSPTASVASRKSSLFNIKNPLAALSVTPATPLTATTKAAVAGESTVPANDAIGMYDRRGRSNFTQPISMPHSPAAAKVTTSDAFTDPKSLSEHSLHHQYFDSAREAGMNTQQLKARIDTEKGRRASRLNPSNPSRSSVMLQNQSRRWINIFPRAGRINNQRSVKWKSLCTPACLPLYTDYIPSTEDLLRSYSKETYSLPVTTGTASFLLRPGKSIPATAGNLLRELVNQRLAQSFQIIMPSYDDQNSARHHERTPSDEAFVLPIARDIKDILYNTARGEGKAIYLGYSNMVHKLYYDRSSSAIVVSTWSERHDWATRPFEYSFRLMPFGSSAYTSRDVIFAYPNLNTYDWKYLDRLVAGLEEPNLQEKTRYWRSRWILIPSDVPDLAGMIKSHSKVLLEDSGEDDVRINGLLTLYELFFKAKWQPPGRDHNKYKSDDL